MPFGYNGCILHVDLSISHWQVEKPDEVWYRTYMGGGAMASYYLLQELSPCVHPLCPENVLIFTSNVLSGAPISGFCRYTVAAKSPLTGGYGESEAGGYFGPELKNAGFDGVVIKGRSPEPVYLWLHDGQVEIRPAQTIWGRDNGETREAVIKELGDKRVRIASIGPAGENQVLFANVINELVHANGRTGMGAVMGSKNLKAIAVRGTGKMSFAHPDKVKSIAQWHSARIKTHKFSVNMNKHGTGGLLGMLNDMGVLPTRNFSQGVFEGAEKITGQKMTETILKSTSSCYACAVGCKRVVELNQPYQVDPKFGGLEYETLAAFGSNCGVSDLAAIAKGHELCNRLGLDTISTGAVIAFAMECFKEGILNQADNDGQSLDFGDPKAMISAIKDIGHRRGLGFLLSQGVKRAAEMIGRGAEKFAFHVKGQEIPFHDPRGKTGVGLSFALSSKGADHIEAAHEGPFQGGGVSMLAPLGIHKAPDPLSLGPDKVKYFIQLQRVHSLFNSIGVCNFTAAPLFSLSFDRLVDAVKAITGWETSLWELLRVGERAVIMSRMFNIKAGVRPEADRLFWRLHEPLAAGPFKGHSIDPEAFEKAVKLYYQMMGWSEEGRPRRAKLIEFDLEWLAEPNTDTRTDRGCLKAS